jgi:hypothetical protein
MFSRVSLKAASFAAFRKMNDFQLWTRSMIHRGQVAANAWALKETSALASAK